MSMNVRFARGGFFSPTGATTLSFKMSSMASDDPIEGRPWAKYTITYIASVIAWDVAFLPIAQHLIQLPTSSTKSKQRFAWPVVLASRSWTFDTMPAKVALKGT